MKLAIAQSNDYAKLGTHTMKDFARFCQNLQRELAADGWKSAKAKISVRKQERVNYEKPQANFLIKNGKMQFEVVITLTSGGASAGGVLFNAATVWVGTRERAYTKEDGGANRQRRIEGHFYGDYDRVYDPVIDAIDKMIQTIIRKHPEVKVTKDDLNWKEAVEQAKRIVKAFKGAFTMQYGIGGYGIAAVFSNVDGYNYKIDQTETGFVAHRCKGPNDSPEVLDKKAIRASTRDALVQKLNGQ